MGPVKTDFLFQEAVAVAAALDVLAPVADVGVVTRTTSLEFIAKARVDVAVPVAIEALATLCRAVDDTVITQPGLTARFEAEAILVVPLVDCVAMSDTALGTGGDVFLAPTLDKIVLSPIPATPPGALGRSLEACDGSRELKSNDGYFFASTETYLSPHLTCLCN